jgi:nitroreductase
MTDLGDLVKRRYSVRAYKPDPVAEEDLEQILEDACLAPTAANRQAFQLIVIHTGGRTEELRQIYDRGWFVQAPIVICACAVLEESWVRSDGKNYADVDVAIVMDHLILSATDRGLGTCWIGAFNRDVACEVLGLPEGVEPIALTPLGYAADEPREKRRKPVSELVRYEEW